jgi:murein DD-endopeptidase MepM/ murein hydrolase activator NlpD
MLVLSLLASLAAVQGQALSIAVPSESGLEAVEVLWEGRDVSFAQTDDGWIGVIGIDLDASPGAHSAELTLHFAGGVTRRTPAEVLVSVRSFPTTALRVEPRFVDLNPEDQARVERENREIAEIYRVMTPARYWREPFRVPIEGTENGRNFGHRRVFNGQARAPHAGADLTASTGTPVLAANRGRVVLAKDLFFSGNAVFLDHGLGLYSVYLHLSEIHVAQDDVVERDAVLGLVGATGRVTGPHLHWGARVIDARVDPFTLLELTRTQEVH